MNEHLVHHIASRAYVLYLNRSKGQLSPDDAKWIAENYVEENPYTTPEEGVRQVLQILIDQE